MKRITLSILAAATVVAGLPAAASAQPGSNRGPVPYEQYQRDYRHAPAQWQNINQRQRELDRRIDMGVRMGRITRREAASLRTEFRRIARLEQTYRRGGLTFRERAELDRQFDRLSMRIRFDANDRDNRGDRGDRGDRGNGYGNGYGDGPRR